MTRNTPEHTNQIQAAPAKTSVLPEPRLTSPVSPASNLPWGWQLALFVWLASFGFLLLNDLLTSIFKIIHHFAG